MGAQEHRLMLHKMAVMALTHNLARFLAPKEICVNCLSPGVISGEFTEKTNVKRCQKNSS